MAAYVLVDIDIHDPAGYEEYKRVASPTVHQYGGRYLARGGRTEVLEGSRVPARTVILEFPSAEAARAWWDSPEYRPLRAIRQRTAETSMILVEGA